MNAKTYRDMHLLNEVTRAPELTQRELSRRVGVALGMVNLMLRRLVKKGYIKISGTKRNRIRYLITPQGILEKSRLTYEFIQYSLQLYGGVRASLRGQLDQFARNGQRRILLCGTGELAEIAYLTIREMGLELIGIAARVPDRAEFLGYPVQRIDEVAPGTFDAVLLAFQQSSPAEEDQLGSLGVPIGRIIQLQVRSADAMPHDPPSLLQQPMPVVPAQDRIEAA